MTKATREVVVLDFHRFPVGFSQNQQRNRKTHADLVAALVAGLGDWMVPFSVGTSVTMNDLWALNKTLIVAYADEWTRTNHPLLWPSIPQEWGDKRSVNDLYFYLDSIDRKRMGYPYFWAAMAELTPSTMDVLFRPNDGLRKLADQVASNVTTWYRDRWWKSTSITAVDFFHTTGIIDVAIQASLKRVHCSNVPNVRGPTSPNMESGRGFYHGPGSLDTTPVTSPPTSGRRRRPQHRQTHFTN